MKNVVTSDYDLIFEGFTSITDEELIKANGSQGFLCDGLKCWEGNVSVTIPSGHGYIDSYENTSPILFSIEPSSINVKSNSLGVILDGDKDTLAASFYDENQPPESQTIVKDVSVTIKAKQTRVKAS